MRASNVAMVRTREVVRALRVLEASGSRVPVISLLPGTMRNLLAEDADPAQRASACLQAIDSIDRQMIVERIRSADLCADPRAAAAIERGILKPYERQAILALVREQLNGYCRNARPLLPTAV